MLKQLIFYTDSYIVLTPLSSYNELKREKYKIKCAALSN